MLLATTITTKGQVTIPGYIRRRLGVSIGDKVLFDDVLEHQKKVTIKIIPTHVVNTLYGSLKTSVHETDHRKARAGAVSVMAKRYNTP